MEKECIEIGTATVKAKVLNVFSGEHPTLLCLVKEFFYIHRGCKKTGKVIFDDYSYKMAFYVQDIPSWAPDGCDAERKVKTLVNGDIVEFTIFRNHIQYYFSSFKVVETEQKCLKHLRGLEHLANKFGRDDE